MTISVFPFLRLVSVCGAALMGSSCLPMFGAGQVLAGSSLAEGLLPSSSLDLVRRHPFFSLFRFEDAPRVQSFSRGFLFPADGSAPGDCRRVGLLS